MLKHPIQRLFIRFVTPSIIAMLVGGFYTIVDGIFVGRYTGEAGLAGITIVFPFAATLMAIGTGIGMGGSTLMSIRMGENRKEEAVKICESTFGGMLLAGIVLSIAGVLTCHHLLAIFTTTLAIFNYALEYGRIIFGGTLPLIVGLGAVHLVRNDGFPKKATVIMVSGALLNTVLDWYFIAHLKIGLAGAAWATVIAEIITAILIAQHFFSKQAHCRIKKISFGLKRIAAICKTGFPAFGMTMTFAVTLFMQNWQCIAYGGTTAVAAFGVLGYLTSIIFMIHEGIALGVQPIVSYNHGARQISRKHLAGKLALGVTLLVSVASMFLFATGRRFFATIFTTDPDVLALAPRAILLTLPAFVLYGIIKILASYFQAIGKTHTSSALIYGNMLIGMPLFLWTLPVFLGLDGVWLAMPASNLTICVLFLIYNAIYPQRVKLPEPDKNKPQQQQAAA